jgi:hypothetical protein
MNGSKILPRIALGIPHPVSETRTVMASQSNRVDRVSRPLPAIASTALLIRLTNTWSIRNWTLHQIEITCCSTDFFITVSNLSLDTGFTR